MSIGHQGFGAAVRQVRTRLGMTTAQLAETIGVNQSTISRYESGERTPRSSVIGALLKIASDAEKLEIIGVLLNTGLIGAPPEISPSELAGHLIASAGMARIGEALLDVLGEKRQDPGIRKFVAGAATMLDKCSTVDGSITEILLLWSAHFWNPKAPGYLRGALEIVRGQLVADYKAIQKAVQEAGGVPEIPTTPVPGSDRGTS